jgi:hypothetical protein
MKILRGAVAAPMLEGDIPPPGDDGGINVQV